MSHVPLPAPGTAGNVITSTGDGWASEPGGGGGGAVDSVNGQTGVVVLDAADVGADASGTAASAVSTHAALTSGVHGISTFGASVVAAADAAAARTVLGISPSVVTGTATATFSGGADSVTVTVADAGVSAGSKIVPSIAMGSRDGDEFEMAPVAVAVGSITAGVGFTLIAVSLDGDAEGAYQINYTRD